MKTESAGLFSRFKANPLLAVLIFLLLGCMVVMGFIVAQLLTYSDKDQHLRDMVAELRASSYQLTSLSRDATAGNKQAFERLSRLVTRMDTSWTQFKDSDPQTRAALNREMTAYEGVWSRVRDNSQVITNNEAAIILMHDVATTLNEALPQLQAEHDNIVEILLENRAPAEQVSMAQRQSWFAERIGRNVDKMLRGGLDADKAADEFNIDANRF